MLPVDERDYIHVFRDKDVIGSKVGGVGWPAGSAYHPREQGKVRFLNTCSELRYIHWVAAFRNEKSLCECFDKGRADGRKLGGKQSLS